MSEDHRNGMDAVSDAQLVSYMHDALDADARAAVESRLAASHATAERLRLLRSREVRLGSMLKLLDPDELSTRRSAAVIAPAVRGRPRATRRATLGRAAAIVLIIGAAALLVEPVRAAAVEGLRSVAAVLGIMPPAAEPPESASAPAVRTAFGWTGPVFTVELPPAAAANIGVERGTDGVVVVTHASAVSVIVGPDGLRIDSSNIAQLSLHLQLPLGTGKLRIRQGGSTTDHELSGAQRRIEVTPDR